MPSLTTFKLLKQEHNARRGEFKTVQNELKGDWLVASSGQVKRFSAVAYYFALELQEKLNVL